MYLGALGLLPAKSWASLPLCSRKSGSVFWGRRLIGPDVYDSMMSEVADLMAALSASSGATSAAKQSQSRDDVTYAAPVPPIVRSVCAKK